MTTVEYSSPCGKLLTGVHGDYIVLCDWMVEGRIEKTLGRLQKYLSHEHENDNLALLQRLASQLDEYFKGRRREFDLPLITFGTEFQKAVWQSLCKIPYGTTVSYKEVADSVSRPAGVRAVANAIGANPLSILIPCHRVVGSNGSLTGYAGGLTAKQYLSGMEKVNPENRNGVKKGRER